MEYTLHATTVIDAPVARIFDRITDLDRLPDWNDEIPRVIERPWAPEPGAEWVVEIRALGIRWNSRSRAGEVDAGMGRFTYRSQSDDGNPSYADWRWQLTAGPDGTRVDVEVDIRPRTFWRRHLLSKLRRSGLHAAMQCSLHALQHQLLNETTEREEA